ncbi:MAG: metallophosphoesterase family protein [Candidatus Omnitrophota bacterium]
MRWAIISDIHSNYEALTAVLSALSKERIDQYLCTGDIVGYGAEPDRCIAEIRKLNPVIVAGNHDWAGVGLFEETSFTDNATSAIVWTREHLNEDSRQFLKSLVLVYEGSGITLVHSSLHQPEKFDYIFTLFSAEKTFHLLKTKICFIGHSHAPLIFINKGKKCSVHFQSHMKLEKECAYIVNVGSVGQPRDGDPRAAYAVYDSERDSIEIKRVDYDIPQAQEKIIQAGLPEILARRLAVGK